MSTVGELLVLLGINDAALTAGLARSEAKVKGFGDTAGSSGGKASAAFAAAGVAGLALAGGVAAIGVASIDSAAKFQESLTQMQNNLHLTNTQAASLGRAIEGAALGTSTSANTMVAALAPVSGELARVQGGTLSAAAATQVLTAAQNLHEAANIDVGTSLKAITDLLLVYHLKASSAATVSNALFQAQAQLGISADTLASMMQRLQPRIAGSGVSLQQLLGITRELEPVVGTGSRAVMTVGTVLQSLLSPSSTAQKALSGLGVSLVDVHGKFVGLPSAITRINDAMARLPETTAKGSKELSRATLLYDLFGKQSNVAAQLLKGGAAGIAANGAALAKTGTAAQAAERNAATLSDQWETLKASVSTVSTTIGTALLPVISRIAQAVLPVIQTVASWISQNPQLTATLLAAAGAVGVVTAAVGLLMAAMSPVVLVVLAIGAAIAVVALAWTQNWGGIQQKVQVVVAAIQPVLQALGRAINEATQWVGALFDRIRSNHDVITALQVALQAVGDVLSVVVQGIENLAVNIGRLVSNEITTLGAAIQAVVPIFQTLWQAAENVVASIQKMLDLAGQAAGAVGKIPGVGLVTGAAGAAGSAVGSILGALPHFQTGGLVGGSGPQLAVVHGGEIVLPPGYLAQPTKGVAAALAVASPTSALASQTAAVDAAKRAMALTSASDAVSRAQMGVGAAERGIASARLAESAAKTARAHEAAAIRLQSAEDRLSSARTTLAAAEQRLALVKQEQALAIEKGLTSGVTTTGTSKTGTTSSSTSTAAAAMIAFAQALQRAISSGVPLTLDGQQVGQMLDQYGYGVAASSTSGFLASGGIVP